MATKPEVTDEMLQSHWDKMSTWQRQVCSVMAMQVTNQVRYAEIKEHQELLVQRMEQAVRSDYLVRGYMKMMSAGEIFLKKYPAEADPDTADLKGDHEEARPKAMLNSHRALDTCRLTTELALFLYQLV